MSRHHSRFKSWMLSMLKKRGKPFCLQAHKYPVGKVLELVTAVFQLDAILSQIITGVIAIWIKMASQWHIVHIEHNVPRISTVPVHLNNVIRICIVISLHILYVVLHKQRRFVKLICLTRLPHYTVCRGINPVVSYWGHEWTYKPFYKLMPLNVSLKVIMTKKTVK